MSNAPLFRLEALGKQRLGPGGRPEFELSVPQLEVAAGEKIGVVAPNGAGKSTLMDLLIFASSPDEAGRFEFLAPGGEAYDIWGLWRNGAVDALGELRKRHIGVVLQTGGLLPFISVRENIDLPRRLLGLAEDGSLGGLAERLDLSRLLDRAPDSLSIGERQRVAIARALAHGPAVVVADEPTASLDSRNAERSMTLLMEMVEDAGVTLIMTSHDRALLEAYGLRLLKHDAGEGPQGRGTRSRFWT
jgi:putative ABC transport system ATP-binding protein